jgi:hypothetical protein
LRNDEIILGLNHIRGFLVYCYYKEFINDIVAFLQLKVLVYGLEDVELPKQCFSDYLRMLDLGDLAKAVSN